MSQQGARPFVLKLFRRRRWEHRYDICGSNFSTYIFLYLSQFMTNKGSASMVRRNGTITSGEISVL